MSDETPQVDTLIVGFHAWSLVGYGPITFDSFSSSVVSAELSKALSIWRNPWTDSDDLASHARQFIDARLHAVGAPEAAEVG